MQKLKVIHLIANTSVGTFNPNSKVTTEIM